MRVLASPGSPASQPAEGLGRRHRDPGLDGRQGYPEVLGIVIMCVLMWSGGSEQLVVVFFMDISRGGQRGLGRRAWQVAFSGRRSATRMLSGRR